MKKLLLLITFSLFLFPFSFSQYTWHNISANIPQTGETQPDLSDVYFVSDNEGWITSSNYAEIYHTTDGGATFDVQTTQYCCNAIHMLDKNEGYAGGASGRVYRTTDGGENWNFHGTMGTTLADISFPPSGDTGYCCGNSGHVWEITSTLTNLNSGSSTTFGGISAPSVNNVWVCGGNRIYYYNGTTFTSQSTPGGTFNDIHFINNLKGWVVGNVGVIGHTADGGTSWVTQTNPDTQNRSLYGVFFLDSDYGWAIGAEGVILHTTNGGTTWAVQGTGLTTAFLRGVHFTSSTNGYVVGNGKTLLKYGEVSGIGDEVENVKFEIYPNPAVNEVGVSSSEFGVESCTIELFDLNGKKLLEKQIPAGTEKFELNVSDLESDVYFCRISADKKSTTKKLIIK